MKKYINIYHIYNFSIRLLYMIIYEQFILIISTLLFIKKIMLKIIL